MSRTVEGERLVNSPSPIWQSVFAPVWPGARRLGVWSRLISLTNVANVLLSRVLTMPDSEQAERSLFFADSADENDDELEYLTPPGPAQSSAASKPEPRPQANSLFFADSGDEDDKPPEPRLPPDDEIMPGITFDTQDASEAMDVDVKLPDVASGRASSVSSASSARLHVPSSPASSVGPENSKEPPRKKRKLSPEASGDHHFEATYLGSFLVADAWSTVRGKGFVKVREQKSVEDSALKHTY